MNIAVLPYNNDHHYQYKKLQMGCVGILDALPICTKSSTQSTSIDAKTPHTTEVSSLIPTSSPGDEVRMDEVGWSGYHPQSHSWSEGCNRQTKSSTTVRMRDIRPTLTPGGPASLMARGPSTMPSTCPTTKWWQKGGSWRQRALHEGTDIGAQGCRKACKGLSQLDLIQALGVAPVANRRHCGQHGSVSGVSAKLDGMEG